jgi:UDP-N-acetylmuramyl pentapeptide phosphotransferase/UDP-N-acetylglucosamine-1-phosphate transferase
LQRIAQLEVLPEEVWLLGASAICAGVAMPLAVRAQRLEERHRPSGPQNIHSEPTSRFGGAAVFLGYAVAIGVGVGVGLVPIHPTLPLLGSSLVLGAVGLWEDIARRVPPSHRLIAAIASAALASAFAQGTVTRLDMPFVDRWLTYLPFALALTWFMVAGACNAVNIIDGNHGLAGGTSLLMFAGLAVVAGHVGDRLVLAQALAIAGALIVFLSWNYPHGKVFLGDAGAYFIGFMYAQLAIQLAARNAGVSAWFVIALAAYPIVETLFSIYRRKILRRSSAMQCDVMHLHSLHYLYFMRSAARARTSRRDCHCDSCGAVIPGDRRRRPVEQPRKQPERRRPLRRANARVARRLWMHAALCFAVAVVFFDSTPVLIVFSLLYAMFYVACYRRALRMSAVAMLRTPQLFSWRTQLRRHPEA